jgi:putative transposase
VNNGPETFACALHDCWAWPARPPPASSQARPGENRFVESFNGRARDELLNIAEFALLADATIVVEAWRVSYDTHRPHSALRRSHPATSLACPDGPASQPLETHAMLERLHRHDVLGGLTHGYKLVAA